MDGVMSPSTPSSSMETIERKRARKNAISTTSSKRFVSTRLFDGSSSMMSTGTAVLKKLNGKVPSTAQTAGVPVPMSLAGCCSPTLPLDGGLANGPIFAMPCPSIQSVAQLHPQMIFGALVTSGLTDAPPTQLFSSFPLKNSCRKHSPIDRLQRSRERNRMHARKTRQRKKEHTQVLQGRADELKHEQIRLRQVINEKQTANILVGLFASADTKLDTMDDPKIEALLRRPVEDIPDATKIPELPALILPGHHNTTRPRASTSCSEKPENKQPQHILPSIERLDSIPDDGIDYDLLGKDRSKCTPQELDRIRRERNRMHAKRTRDRKRLFMDEMEELIKALEDENKMLVNYLSKLGNEMISYTASETPTAALVSPSLAPVAPNSNGQSPSPSFLNKADFGRTDASQVVGQLKSLLAAAGAFEQMRDTQNTMDLLSSAATAVSVSADVSGNSCCSDHDSEYTQPKRQRLMVTPIPMSVVPSSITTTTATVGC